jgi:hypothetical protein
MNHLLQIVGQNSGFEATEIGVDYHTKWDEVVHCDLIFGLASINQLQLFTYNVGTRRDRKCCRSA